MSTKAFIFGCWWFGWPHYYVVIECIKIGVPLWNNDAAKWELILKSLFLNDVDWLEERRNSLDGFDWIAVHYELLCKESMRKVKKKKWRKKQTAKWFVQLILCHFYVLRRNYAINCGRNGGETQHFSHVYVVWLDLAIVFAHHFFWGDPRQINHIKCTNNVSKNWKQKQTCRATTKKHRASHCIN